MNFDLTKLDRLGGVVEKLKQKSRSDDTYWKNEEALVQKRLDARKSEAKLITMTQQKYHQAFSL